MPMRSREIWETVEIFTDPIVLYIYIEYIFIDFKE